MIYPCSYELIHKREKDLIDFLSKTTYAAREVTGSGWDAAVATARDDRGAAARIRLIEDHLPLVRRIALRFTGRGERLEDLVQVGAIGLIGAVDRCDPERTERLTAYVASCVEGEIRRHLRDRCAVVRIPRRIQQDVVLAAAARSHLHLEEDFDAPAALCEPVDELSLARALVTSAAHSLDRRERRVVALRYFGDLSQAEIGDVVGLSQVHVSRLLQGAIEKMRARLDPEGVQSPAASV
jgi:RNA polymerase sigma-B factor